MLSGFSWAVRRLRRPALALVFVSRLLRRALSFCVLSARCRGAWRVALPRCGVMLSGCPRPVRRRSRRAVALVFVGRPRRQHRISVGAQHAGMDLNVLSGLLCRGALCEASKDTTLAIVS